MSYEGNTYSTNSGTIVTGAKYPNRMMTVGVLFKKQRNRKQIRRGDPYFADGVVFRR